MEEAGSERVAYVKLKNAASTDKALSNLHKNKVGVADLVEECVVSCHRWHQYGWSDSTCRATFFVDQLAMTRRPLEGAPGPEDRELFVKNLPLKDMNRQELLNYFGGFGEVDDLHLITDTSTGEPNGEGYVRFKSHADARRCIEALPPEAEAEESKDLTGWWSESERVLQRKANIYRFNLICELVGRNGVELERLKTGSNVKDVWMLAESLQQRARHAPPRSGRQVHFVARCPEETNAAQFREMLERALEDAHNRISDRIEKRKRKAEGGNKENTKAPAAKPAEVPAVQAPWAAGAPPPGAWPPAPGGYWPPPGGAPPSWGYPPGQGPPPGYPPPGHPPWGHPPPGVGPFDQGQPPAEKKERHKRRRHRGEGGEAAEGGEGEDGKPEKKRKRRHRDGGAAA